MYRTGIPQVDRIREHYNSSTDRPYIVEWGSIESILQLLDEGLDIKWRDSDLHKFEQYIDANGFNDNAKRLIDSLYVDNVVRVNAYCNPEVIDYIKKSGLTVELTYFFPDTLHKMKNYISNVGRPIPLYYNKYNNNLLSYIKLLRLPYVITGLDAYDCDIIDELPYMDNDTVNQLINKTINSGDELLFYKIKELGYRPSEYSHRPISYDGITTLRLLYIINRNFDYLGISDDNQLRYYINFINCDTNLEYCLDEQFNSMLARITSEIIIYQIGNTSFIKKLGNIKKLNNIKKLGNIRKLNNIPTLNQLAEEIIRLESESINNHEDNMIRNVISVHTTYDKIMNIIRLATMLISDDCELDKKYIPMLLSRLNNSPVITLIIELYRYRIINLMEYCEQYPELEMLVQDRPIMTKSANKTED